MELIIPLIKKIFLKIKSFHFLSNARLKLIICPFITTTNKEEIMEINFFLFKFFICFKIKTGLFGAALRPF